MEAEREREKTTEELEREENQRSEPTATQAQASKLTDAVEAQSRPLMTGPSLATPFGPLPKRSLAGIALLVAVAVVVYLILWSLFGTLGLLLGWIPAVLLGFVAARELGRRAEA